MYHHLKSHLALWVLLLLRLYFVIDYLRILRMLRMVVSPGRERNTACFLPATLLKGPTLILASATFFTVSSSTNPFLINLKILFTWFICWCLNEGYPSRNLKKNWLPTLSGSFVTSRKATRPLGPRTWPNIQWHLLHDLSRECRVISIIIKFQRQREYFVSDSFFRIHKASLEVILVSLIMGRIHLSSWLFLALCNPVSQDYPHVTGALPTQKAQNSFWRTMKSSSHLFWCFFRCQSVLCHSLYPLTNSPLFMDGTACQLTYPSLHLGPTTYHLPAHLLAELWVWLCLRLWHMIFVVALLCFYFCRETTLQSFVFAIWALQTWPTKSLPPFVLVWVISSKCEINVLWKPMLYNKYETILSKLDIFKIQL